MAKARVMVRRLVQPGVVDLEQVFDNYVYVDDKNDVPKVLNEIKKSGDIIITMGAGDIWKQGESFVELLRKSA